MNQKLPPYDRLKIIMKEGDKPELTDNANKNLNDILGIKNEKESFNLFNYISSFFKKIDSYIFKKSSRRYNTLFYKRKKS